MERYWVVYVCGAPIHDGFLSYIEATLLYERWVVLCDDVIMEEVDAGVVQ